MKMSSLLFVIVIVTAKICYGQNMNDIDTSLCETYPLEEQFDCALNIIVEENARRKKVRTSKECLKLPYKEFAKCLSRLRNQSKEPLKARREKGIQQESIKSDHLTYHGGTEITFAYSTCFGVLETTKVSKNVLKNAKELSLSSQEHLPTVFKQFIGLGWLDKAYPSIRKAGRTIKIVETSKVSNAAAVRDGDQFYIMYNPTWINSKRMKWSVHFVVAHELGHHYRLHLTNRSEITSHTKEEEADFNAGYMLHSMGVSLKDTQKPMHSIASVNDSLSHPGLEKRLKAIERGWKHFDTVRQLAKKGQDAVKKNVAIYIGVKKDVYMYKCPRCSTSAIVKKYYFNASKNNIITIACENCKRWLRVNKP